MSCIQLAKRLSLIVAFADLTGSVEGARDQRDIMLLLALEAGCSFLRIKLNMAVLVQPINVKELLFQNSLPTLAGKQQILVAQQVSQG